MEEDAGTDMRRNLGLSFWRRVLEIGTRDGVVLWMDSFSLRVQGSTVEWQSGQAIRQVTATSDRDICKLGCRRDVGKLGGSGRPPWMNNNPVSLSFRFAWWQDIDAVCIWVMDD